MKNYLIIAGIVIIALVSSFFTISYYKTPPNLGSVSYNVAPRFVVASSTVFSLTTTSVRLLATSSPARLASLIQPVNCTTSGTTVFVSPNRDIAAVAGTGIAIFASTTLAQGDYPHIPVVQGSVQGITGAGTCTVLVTEWRSQY